MDWKLIEQYDCKKEIAEPDGRFRIGNGYMSMYGQLDEQCQYMIPAHSLNGILISGENGWRTFLHTPNPCFTSLFLEQEEYAVGKKEILSHQQELDYRHGIWSRRTSWMTPKGKLTIYAERFTSREKQHALFLQYRILPEFDGKIRLKTGIDLSERNAGQHLWQEYECEQVRGFSSQNTILKVTADLHQNENGVHMMEAVTFPYDCEQWIEQEQESFVRNMEFSAEKGKEYVLTKYVTQFSRQDSGFYDIKNAELLEEITQTGYQKEKELHEKCWETVWENCDIRWDIAEDMEIKEQICQAVYALSCIPWTDNRKKKGKRKGR